MDDHRENNNYASGIGGACVGGRTSNNLEVHGLHHGGLNGNRVDEGDSSVGFAGTMLKKLSTAM